MLPDVSVHVYCKCTEIDRSELSWVLSPSNKLDRWSKLENILSHFQTVDDVTTSKMSQAIGILQNCENVENVDEKHLFPLKFLAEQLTLRNAPRKMYGTEILLWAYQLFITSFKAYAFVRKSVLILPNESYLRRLTSCLSLSSSVEHDVTTHPSYLKKKAEQLEPHERIVALLLDEIHVQPSASVKGGGIQGFAAKPLQQATTV